MAGSLASEWAVSYRRWVYMAGIRAVKRSTALLFLHYVTGIGAKSSADKTSASKHATLLAT